MNPSLPQSLQPQGNHGSKTEQRRSHISSPSPRDSDECLYKRGEHGNHRVNVTLELTLLADGAELVVLDPAPAVGGAVVVSAAVADSEVEAGTSAVDESAVGCAVVSGVVALSVVAVSVAGASLVVETETGPSVEVDEGDDGASVLRPQAVPAAPTDEP